MSPAPVAQVAALDAEALAARTRCDRCELWISPEEGRACPDPLCRLGAARLEKAAA